MTSDFFNEKSAFHSSLVPYLLYSTILINLLIYFESLLVDSMGMAV
jgi:hypothetical protein